MNDREVSSLLDQLVLFGENAPSLEQKLRMLELIRSYSVESGIQADRFLLSQLKTIGDGLDELLAKQQELKALIEKVMTPPWHPAILVSHTLTANGEAAVVAQGGTRSVVKFGPAVDSTRLKSGDEVLLSGERNFVVDTPLYPVMDVGETAVFDRYTPDGRVVLQIRDEDFVVKMSDGLSKTELQRGDLVRWNRSILMAFEKLERKKGDDLFIEETPKETFAEIGGLHHQIATLQQAISLQLEYPEIARQYQLQRKSSVLLVGPPGTGKTMVARALANWIAQLSPSKRSRFINVKPGGLHSMWFGQSEANYREFFRLAREAGEREPEVPVVMFFDEVDAIGSARGSSINHVDDKVLTAFMTELDGLEARGNILVVGATNRHDILDPALLRPGRLGDLVLEVPRPDRRATTDILSKHLSTDLPYLASPNQDSASSREEILESLTSLIFAPNGIGALATLTLRDGSRRTVESKDLISGAVLAKIASGARESAALRAINSSKGGLSLEDLVRALNDELHMQAATLTPANCRQFISDLPNDLDVTRVSLVRRRVERAVRYLNAA